MFLRKQVETSHGITADFWAITRGTFRLHPVTDTYSVNAVVELYTSREHCAAGAPSIDACTFSVSGLTFAQINSNIGDAFMAYLTTSVLDSENNETNFLSSTFSGKVSFVGAEIVSKLLTEEPKP